MSKFLRFNDMVVNANFIVMLYERQTKRGTSYFIKVREGSLVNEYEITPYEYDSTTRYLTERVKRNIRFNGKCAKNGTDDSDEGEGGDDNA